MYRPDMAPQAGNVKENGLLAPAAAARSRRGTRPAPNRRCEIDLAGPPRLQEREGRQRPLEAVGVEGLGLGRLEPAQPGGDGVELRGGEQRPARPEEVVTVIASYRYSKVSVAVEVKNSLGRF